MSSSRAARKLLTSIVPLSRSRSRSRSRSKRVACDSMHRHLGDAPSRAPIGTRAPNRPATMHDLAPLGWWQR